MAEDLSGSSAPQTPTPGPKPAGDRAAYVLEWSKILVPVIGTILVACLSGVFLLINNGALFRPAPPAVLVVTATPWVSLTPAPAVLVVTATPAVSSTPEPTRGPEPTLDPERVEWTLVMREDFSDNHSGWDIFENENVRKEYSDGGYLLTIKKNEKETFAGPTVNRLLKDVRVTVDVVKLAGEGPTDIGLMCRYETSGDFYALSYYFDMGGVGRFGIYRWDGPVYQTLGEAVIRDTTWINPGKQANRLRAECVGSLLALYVNDHKAIAVTDETLQGGNVGVLAGYAAGVQVFYDNFVVEEPLVNPACGKPYCDP